MGRHIKSQKHGLELFLLNFHRIQISFKMKIVLINLSCSVKSGANILDATIHIFQNIYKEKLCRGKSLWIGIAGRSAGHRWAKSIWAVSWALTELRYLFSCVWQVEYKWLNSVYICRNKKCILDWDKVSWMLLFHLWKFKGGEHELWTQNKTDYDINKVFV